MLNKNIDKYLLVGAPNTGKSTFYNKITWKTSPVGNVDRVTTFALTASLRKDKNIKIIDLPGTLTLNAMGDDERETFSHIFNDDYNGVINILNVRTLKRDLMLTYDLAEAGTLSLINLNMIDEVNDININKIQLTKEFKVLVNEISAKKNINVQSSIQPLLNRKLKTNDALVIKYCDRIEKFITEFEKNIPNHKLSKRFIITQALMGNEFILEWFEEKGILLKYKTLLKKYKFKSEEIDNIRISKQLLIDKLVSKVMINKDNTIKKTNLNNHGDSKFQKGLDKVFLNKYWSIPIFFLIIAFIWFITFYEYTGGWLQAKLAEDALGALQGTISDSILNLNSGSTLQLWFSSFVADGILGGIFTVVSFIPWIVILVFFMSVLEQIGILSRMSIVFDKVFDKFGLSGRGIINMIAGVGCNIPSILMARNSTSKKERITTILIMPFVSCSARVIVIAFIAQVFVSTELTWIVNLGITILSWAFALFMGYFFSNILFRKSSTLFIGELNPYRSPDFYVVFKKVLLEVYDFVKRVILIVGVANLFIWFLQSTTPNSKFISDLNDPNYLQTSFLRYISIPFQIILYPLGIGEHWQLSISLVTAFPAKEIASSNIALIFGGDDLGIEGFKNFMYQIPLWRSTALSFITFFTFYIPCLATVSVMWKEIGKKYTMIHIGTSLLGTWIMSFIVFSFSGLIERLFITSNQLPFIIMLIVISIITFAMILNQIYKSYKWKNESVWNFKQWSTYKAIFWSNNGLFATSLLVSNLMCFLLIT
ncbi:MAG: ferrous iron transport protein B [Mycoplasma sp.]